MLLGQIPFAGSATAQGIDEAEALVEFRVCAGSGWGKAVERREQLAPSLAFRVGPDWDRVGSGLDEFREGWSGVGGGHAPGHAPADGREGIASPVQHELKQGVAIRLAVCQKKPGGFGAFDGPVSLRLAEAQRGGELVVGEVAGDGQFDRHNEVLGFELHAASIYSLFMNREHH